MSTKPLPAALSGGDAAHAVADPVRKSTSKLRFGSSASMMVVRFAELTAPAALEIVNVYCMYAPGIAFGKIVVPLPAKFCGSQMVLTDLVKLSATPVFTVRVAMALLVMPTDTPVTLAGVLLYVPPTPDLTGTTIVQLARPDAMAPPLNVIVPSPTGAETVPPHCVADGADATTTLVGNVSVKAKPPCCGAPAPLVMVNVRSDDWPITTVDGPKALVSVVPTTTKVSLILGAVSPPCSEPDGILLVAAVGEVLEFRYEPGVALDTVMTMVHEALPARSMPNALIPVLVPATNAAPAAFAAPV